MNETILCHSCNNYVKDWGKDPMGVICNNCFQKVEQAGQVQALAQSASCLQCLYWINIDENRGRCRNSYSPFFKNDISASESCACFLSVD